MKKAIRFILLCTALACLSGCGSKIPAMAADGTSWDKDWITLGGVLGVEKPGHELTLRDDKAARNMCYTAWSIGNAQPYVNSSGEETNLYDAQLVLLLMGSSTVEEAQMNMEEWLDLATNNYSVTNTAQQIYNNQEFTVLTYTFPSNASPYTHGVSAFTVFDTWAISAEFVCQDTFVETAQTILSDFLAHCHYAEQ